MKIEDQVVSLELAKKLKELGVTQKSCFEYYERWKWVERGDIKIKETYGDTGFQQTFDQNSLYEEGFYYYAAFTVPELSEMLRAGGAKNFIKAYGDVFNFPGTSFVGDLGVMNLMRKPDMAAKMLIYLLENKLTDVPR